MGGPRAEQERAGRHAARAAWFRTARSSLLWSALPLRAARLGRRPPCEFERFKCARPGCAVHMGTGSLAGPQKRACGVRKLTPFWLFRNQRLFGVGSLLEAERAATASVRRDAEVAMRRAEVAEADARSAGAAVRAARADEGEMLERALKAEDALEALRARLRAAEEEAERARRTAQDAAEDAQRRMERASRAVEVGVQTEAEATQGDELLGVVRREKEEAEARAAAAERREKTARAAASQTKERLIERVAALEARLEAAKRSAVQVAPAVVAATASAGVAHMDAPLGIGLPGGLTARAEKLRARPLKRHEGTVGPKRKPSRRASAFADISSSGLSVARRTLH